MSNPKIVYGDVAIGADSAASVTATAESFCDASQIPFGGDDNSLITLERNAWALDGTKNITTNQPSYWSTVLSGSDSSFSSSPKITISFSANYTVSGLTFYFANSEWCSDITLKAYRGTTLLLTAAIAPTASFFVYEQVIESFNKLEFTINKTSLPYRRAKIDKILFGVVREYKKSDLQSVSDIDEIKLTSTEVSINTLNFKMYPQSSAELIFQKRQPLSLYDGNRLVGTYYLSEGKQTAANVYDIAAEDAIGVLNSVPFAATKYDNASAVTTLQSLLSGFEYEIDAALSSEKLTGYIPKGTKREALHHIAFALRAVADCTGGKIRIYRPAATVSANFGTDKVYTGGAIEKTPTITAVRVWAHRLTSSSSGNITIGTTKYRDDTTMTEIANPMRVASDPDNIIEIEHATLVNSSNVVAVAQWVLDNAFATKLTAKMLVNGEKPGDYVTAKTPTGATMRGYITKTETAYTSVSAANVEIVGEII